MAALYNRLYSYVASTVLSDVILAALVDQLPSFPKNSKEKYVIGTVSISLIFWFIFTVGDIVDSLINVIIGNVVENGEYNFREQTRRKLHKQMDLSFLNDRKNFWKLHQQPSCWTLPSTELKLFLNL